MKEQIYDLERIRKLEETSRNGYNDTPMSDNIFTGKKTTTSNEIDVSKEITSINKVKIDEETKWFYNITNENSWNKSGCVYAVDKEGNLIAKFAVSDTDTKLINIEGMQLENGDENKVFEAVTKSRKEINFLKEQQELKEEIKGYPEFNEKLFQLYEHDKTLIRFKNQKNLLRALLNPKNRDLFRFMLTLCSFNKKETYDDLINDGIINENVINSSNYFTKRLFDVITNYTKAYGQMPSVQFAVNTLELPYSQEFFTEYLLNEDELEIVINVLYKDKKKSFCRQLSNNLANNTISPDEAIEELIKIDTLCTPINYNDTFNSLKENLEERKNEVVLSTGIESLDNKNVFLQKGKVGTVFAFTGSFKTMFCTNIAYNTIKNGGNVLYISLEISKDDMYINFLSRHSYNFDKKLSHSDIKANRLTPNDETYLFETIYPDFKDKLKSNLIIYDETDIKQNDYTGVNKLLSEADKKFIKQTKKGIDLIIIDHLNLFKFGKTEKNINDYAAINHWMSYFRKNCINFLGQKKQVSILCACQSSREGYKNAVSKGKYELTGIAEGNEIERSSQLVLSIFTDEAMKKDNEAIIQILKIRDESADDSHITVKLDPKYYTFGIDNNSNEKNNSISDNGSFSNYENNISEFDDDIEEE